jgi:iron complex outermembrane receptor protein
VTFGQRGYAVADVSIRRRASTFFSSFAGGEFTGDTGTDTFAVSPRIVLRGTIGNLSHQFVGGGDITSASEDITNTSIFNGFPSVGTFTLEKDSQALFVRDEVTAGPFTVAGGYRFDTADYTFEPGAPSTRSFDAHAANVGVSLRASPETTLFANVARAFRYPVLDELFDFFSNTILTGITPQRSTDIEGGLRMRRAGVAASLSVFRFTADDEIFFNPAGGAFGFGANENLDGTSHRNGVSLAASAPIGRVALRGSYTWTDPSTDGGAYDKQPLPGVAAHRGHVQAHVDLNQQLSLSLDALFVGKRPFEGDFASQFGDHDGYALVDVNVAYRQGRARLFVDLKNLFDEHYSEYGALGGFPTERAYYPSPGRHALAGLEIEF